MATLSSSSSTFSLSTLKKNGETLYGIFLLSFSPTLAEIAGLAGYDFAVVDMEHGHGGISDALPCLHALAATRTPAILRIPESYSPKDARKAVSYCRFPPNGVRGSAHTVVRASDYGIDEGYLSNYEEELLIMCQVECADGVKKIDEIACVEGVDCIQMGPLDLSASLGYLWDPGHKKVKEVLRAAEKAVLETNPGEGKGAYLSGFAMPHDKPENLKQRGYHMVSGAVDIGLFRSAAVEDVKKFNNCLMEDDEQREDDKDSDEKYWIISSLANNIFLVFPNLCLSPDLTKKEVGNGCSQSPKKLPFLELSSFSPAKPYLLSLLLPIQGWRFGFLECTLLLKSRCLYQMVQESNFQDRRFTLFSVPSKPRFSDTSYKAILQDLQPERSDLVPQQWQLPVQYHSSGQLFLHQWRKGSLRKLTKTPSFCGGWEWIRGL
nr:2-keto-3-deoxy-L-rhamnonate aldolase-like [Ipomoea batatas]